MPATVNDLLVFYDIDGSGEEGMAITRSNHLVNNNTGTLYDISDLLDVQLKEGFFFWSEIVVRRRGSRKFEPAGYAENGPGRALVSILGNLIDDALSVKQAVYAQGPNQQFSDIAISSAHS